VRRVQRFGSVIGLRAEFEERYIILHKHTFPGVLKRIRDSNIRNYSIFLKEGRLFSYYEYHGQDYEGDMQKIGEDRITQDWWKLTDPMQEPVPDRKEREWWASTDEIGHFSGTGVFGMNTQRLAYTTKAGSLSVQKLEIPENVVNAGPLHKISVFHKGEWLYLYCERRRSSKLSPVESEDNVLDTVLSLINFSDELLRWESMTEVFHTD
jgi:L-rhamnose mutarotase